ncbi:MAG: 4Fe-4S ferredoxin [Treponema sp.]|jgi:Fe-S-cluster-containing hydrogenase component 2|nr:4Fe-4S ferredoxin [Treponema sp.]
MPAFRNIRLCDKDCMCLYVCPTGATNTENSIIDVTKCIPGCMECVNACPSGAISMLPDKYPPQQPKTKAVIATQRALGQSKVMQEAIADAVAASTNSAITRQFAEAMAKSNRRMAEDILRESGYMLPQSKKVRKLLETMLKNSDSDPAFPLAEVELLINRLAVS